MPDNNTIFQSAIIVDPSNVKMGHDVRIDDFVKIIGTGGIKIGNYVHIASFCVIMGKGGLTMEDFTGLSCGCRIITETYDMDSSYMLVPTVPTEYTNSRRGRIIMKKHSALGTNTVVFPGVVIGEGAVTAVNTVVTKNLESWTYYGGAPARKIGTRDKESVLRMEKELYEHGN